MTVCEFLHCSFSELPSRCSSLVDQILILKYIKKKGELEKQMMEDARGPSTSQPTMSRRPS